MLFVRECTNKAKQFLGVHDVFSQHCGDERNVFFAAGSELRCCEVGGVEAKPCVSIRIFVLNRLLNYLPI